jgi:hypothetical protein
VPGTVAVALNGHGNIRRVVCTCVADAAAATFPATVLPNFEGRLLALLTTPGSPAPTNGYSLTVTDASGHDCLEGVGAARSSTLSQKVPIFFSGTDTFPPIALADVLTLNITGNAVNSAAITVVLYFALGG